MCKAFNFLKHFQLGRYLYLGLVVSLGTYFVSEFHALSACLIYLLILLFLYIQTSVNETALFVKMFALLHTFNFQLL